MDWKGEGNKALLHILHEYVKRIHDSSKERGRDKERMMQIKVFICSSQLSDN